MRALVLPGHSPLARSPPCAHSPAAASGSPPAAASSPAGAAPDHSLQIPASRLNPTPGASPQCSGTAALPAKHGPCGTRLELTVGFVPSQGIPCGIWLHHREFPIPAAPRKGLCSLQGFATLIPWYHSPGWGHTHGVMQAGRWKVSGHGLALQRGPELIQAKGMGHPIGLVLLDQPNSLL